MHLDRGPRGAMVCRSILFATSEQVRIFFIKSRHNSVRSRGVGSVEIKKGPGAVGRREALWSRMDVLARFADVSCSI